MLVSRPCEPLVALVLASLCAASALAQTPDWSRLEAETMEHFQALLRFDTTDPPGGEKPAADYLKQVLEKEGIEVETFALEPHRPNVVARLKGNGKKRPLLIMAHTDTVNVDPEEVDVPAVLRDPRRRLRLQPRHGRRQGQRGRGAHAHAAAEKDERSPRPRRDLPRGGRRRRVDPGRNPVHGESAPPEDRGRVLPRRGRRHHPRRGESEVRLGPDHREDPLRRGGDRPRRRGTWIGSAQDQLHRSPFESGRGHRRLEPAHPAQRDHQHVLREARLDLGAGGSCALPERSRSRDREGGRRSTSSSTSRGTRRCCALPFHPTFSRAATE